MVSVSGYQRGELNVTRANSGLQQVYTGITTTVELQGVYTRNRRSGCRSNYQQPRSIRRKVGRSPAIGCIHMRNSGCYAKALTKADNQIHRSVAASVKQWQQTDPMADLRKNRQV